MQKWFSVLGGLVAIVVTLLLTTGAQATQCLRVVHPSGFIAEVKWFSSGTVAYSYDDKTDTYSIDSLPAPAKTEYIAIGSQSCYFDIVRMEPGIAVVSIFGGQYADEFVKFMANSTIGLASGTLSGATCALFIGCPLADFVAGKVAEEVKRVTVKKLPQYQSIIYVGVPSSHFFTDIKGDIYYPEVVTSSEPAPRFEMFPAGVLEDSFVQMFAPPRQGTLQGANPLRHSENVNLGTCAAFCAAHQGYLGCAGYNFDTATSQCQTVTFPAVGQPCMSYNSGTVSFYRLKTAPDIRFADCSVTQEEDLRRQMELEASREQ
ncbi:hypothetical protein [Devosia sp.]|uniref:hypothetical protein n=1 Tax=Devosia sp. TaxID=1871048 RepID=UPI0035B43B18